MRDCNIGAHMELRPDARTVCTPVCIDSANQPCTATLPVPLVDPDRVRVFDAWPMLPEHIRRAILALVATVI